MNVRSPIKLAVLLTVIGARPLQFDQLNFIWRIAINLVCTQIDERRFWTMSTRSLQKIKGSCCIDVEIIEGP